MEKIVNFVDWALENCEVCRSGIKKNNEFCQGRMKKS